MARFFASTCRAGAESSAPSAGTNGSSTAGASSAACSKPNSTAGSRGSGSRWGRRPRLRRQHAHDFDQALEKSIIPAPALSRESLGSGYTEAPSSRGASETLSACSPSAAGLEDFLGDVSDDDLSWLEAELPPAAIAVPCAASSDREAGEDSAALSEADKLQGSSCPAALRYHSAPPLELRVEDFECGECIGKGSYSRVFMGTHVVSGTEWALKVVSKRKTFETRENLAHLREEKNIASKLQGSDFLVRTAGTFQNPRR